MSDFDKEAEREKLREKYEQDKEEREATQRMSDLLLKGATMTNAHCGTCGDPLFQENGTTFCPSCHGNPDAVQGTDLEAQPAEEPPTDDGAAGEGANRTDTTDTAAAGTAGDDSAPSRARAETADDATSATHRSGDEHERGTRTDTSASTAEAQPRPTTPSDREDSSPSSPDRRPDSGTRRRAPATSPSPADGDLEAARDALVRTLEKFAEEAAATDDPRYARDCLEAAREAGETLSTLR